MTLKDMSYMYPTFPIIGTICMVLCLYPVPAHWQAGNIATTSLAMWTSIGLLICVVNTCVWHGNIRNPHPVWGDIVNLYFSVLSTAIACCAFCIQYRLWTVARASTVFVTKKEKGRQKLVTCFWCFGVPIIVAGLHYVVQGHRYDIFEDLGPTTETYNVTLSFAIYWVWEPVICIIGGILGILTIRLLLKRRKIFDEMMNGRTTNLNRDRYMRLLALAAFSAIVHVPLAVWLILVNSTQFTVYPWISWEDTHSDYHRISYFNRFAISTVKNLAIYRSIAWWSLPLCGLTVFVFFGSGEAATPYTPIIRACLKPFGITYPREKKIDSGKRIKRTWLDVILRRPGSALNSIPSASMPQFGTTPSMTTPSMTNPSMTYSSGQTQTTTVGFDSVIEVPQGNFLSFGSVGTQAGNMAMVTDKDPEKDSASSETPDAGKVNFDLEAQQSPAHQETNNEIPESDPELTEEVTF